MNNKDKRVVTVTDKNAMVNTHIAYKQETTGEL